MNDNDFQVLRTNRDGISHVVDVKDAVDRIVASGAYADRNDVYRRLRDGEVLETLAGVYQRRRDEG